VNVKGKSSTGGEGREPQRLTPREKGATPEGGLGFTFTESETGCVGTGRSEGAGAGASVTVGGAGDGDDGVVALS
jgi:hypothetical protein